MVRPAFRGNIALLFIMGTGCFSPTLSAQGIPGSRHDFSDLALPGGSAAHGACVACHSEPGESVRRGAPAWNRALGDAAFRSYAPFENNGEHRRQVSGSSMLCLSCHDGLLATDGISHLGSGAAAGVSHPVSVVYDSSTAASKPFLKDPSHPSGLGGSITDAMLIDGRIECSSCHDVHAFTPQGGMLVRSNEGSALCLTCHQF